MNENFFENLKPGDKVNVILKFVDGGSITVPGVIARRLSNGKVLVGYYSYSSYLERTFKPDCYSVGGSLVDGTNEYRNQILPYNELQHTENRENIRRRVLRDEIKKLTFSMNSKQLKYWIDQIKEENRE